MSLIEEMETTMKLVILILFVLMASTVQAQQSPRTQQSAQIFSGTVEAVDEAQAKITVKNDLGQDVPLQLLNPDLLKGISVGDRVSVQLEKPGVAKKIAKLTVPELPAPPEMGK
jgi:hypothetical protein